MDSNTELIEALQGIQAELRRINQTLSGLTAQQGKPAPGGEPIRGGRGREGGYARSEMSGGPPTLPKTKDRGSRFPKKAGSSRGTAKSPAKKGDGYPKKKSR